MHIGAPSRKPDHFQGHNVTRRMPKTRISHPTRPHFPFAARTLTLDRYRGVRSERRRSRNALKSRNERPSKPPMKHRHFKFPSGMPCLPRGRGNPIGGRSSIESRGTKHKSSIQTTIYCFPVNTLRRLSQTTLGDWAASIPCQRPLFL